jgi:adenylate cyclase
MALTGLVLAIFTVLFGVFVERRAGPAAADRLVGTDASSDPRVVVLAFDSRIDGAIPAEESHLRATTYRDIAVTAKAQGARSVGFLDFDSTRFSDGAGGRANTIDSDALQDIAVIPVTHAALVDRDSELPLLIRFRIDALSAEVAGIGLLAPPGPGVVRTVPAAARGSFVVNGAEVEIPAAAIDAYGRDAAEVVPGFAVRLVSLAERASITDVSTDSLRIGDRKVVLEHGTLRVRWADDLLDAGRGRVFPVEDAGSIPPGALRDAIVLVGTVDPTKTEFIETPQGDLPPVLVQANAVNTVLSGSFVEPRGDGLAFAVAALLAVGVLALPIRRERAVVLVVLVTICVWLAYARWSALHDHPVPVLLVPATAAAVIAMLLGRRAVRTAGERRRLRTLFAQYVPTDVAEQLIGAGRDQRALQGERLDITALFVDIRGFTPLCAGMAPSEVREMLNVFYEHMGGIVFAEGGTVLQYVGDEVFSVFGAPLPSPNHVETALRAAHAMLERLPELNRALADRGLPPINVGIGIHSGDVVAAHVGSSVRMQYAVMGDTVNVARHHCSLAAPGEIAISAVTASRMGVLDDATIGVTPIKGIGQPVEVYRISIGPRERSGDSRLPVG